MAIETLTELSGQTRYILEDVDHPVLESDPATWLDWMRDHAGECLVGDDEVSDNLRLVTTFIGIDHTGELLLRPMLWETHLLRRLPSGWSGFQIGRWTSRGAAAIGHRLCVEDARIGAVV